MKNKEIKEEYCKDFGYGSFNKYNESDYSKWLESKLIKEREQVKKLTITDVSQQRELLAFVKEVAEWDKDYSSTNIKLKAKELLKANCG